MTSEERKKFESTNFELIENIYIYKIYIIRTNLVFFKGRRYNKEDEEKEMKKRD